MATNRVQVKQTTVTLDGLASDLAKLLGAKVGYLADTTGPQTYDNGLTLASNAAIHEFGGGNVPPRPFMRTGAEAFDQQDRAIGSILTGVIDGKVQPKEGSNRLGVILQTEIKRAIRGGDFAPLKAATIKRKGSSAPLIDTGRLRQGVDVRTK